jgi:hypothetical protein
MHSAELTGITVFVHNQELNVKGRDKVLASSENIM